jgi:transcriptional regulator with GAF, ATPase, and Fis domain
MEQGQGSQAPESFEQGREAPEQGVHPYRSALESTLRLHNLMDPERLLPQVPEVLRGTLGACVGALIVRHEGEDAVHPIGAFDVQTVQRPHVKTVIDKSIESGSPVVDGQGVDRHVAVPLGAGNRRIGALYLGVHALEERLGNAYLDLLGLLGRQIGLALDNAAHVRDMASVSAVGVEDAIPSGLSLRESKRLFERRLVRARLRESRGNIAAAARSLDMDRGQLSRLLKKHEINKLDFKNPRG